MSADGSLVYVGSSDGYLYSFFVADGSLNWKASCTSTDFATPYGVRSTPALSPSGEEIYVGSDDGYLYAFSTGADTTPTTPAEEYARYCGKGDHPHDCRALVELAQATDYTKWVYNDKWLNGKDSLCDWQLVGCNKAGELTD